MKTNLIVKATTLGIGAVLLAMYGSAAFKHS